MANLTVEIDLTDTEENNMKSHLVDIDAWVLALTTEKVNNCWIGEFICPIMKDTLSNAPNVIESLIT